MLGTVVAPALSPTPLTITDGVFNLFVADPTKPGYRFMRYRMRLTADSGRVRWLYGFKHIGNDSPLDAFHDSTTLYTTIHDGPDERAPIVAQGIVKIGVKDTLKLIATLQIPGALGFFRRAYAKVQFLGHFLGTIALTYLRDLRHAAG